jgi:membrane protein
MATNIMRKSRQLVRFCGAWPRRFYLDGCLLHASALTYTTLLSIVPLLALMFAAVKGLGIDDHLGSLLLQRLALSEEVIQQILTWVDRTNVGTLGTLGAVALVGTVISVLGNIESSFNHIWRVRQGRPVWRKISDYVSVVILAPFLMVAATGVTSFLAQQQLLQGLLEREAIGDAWQGVLPLVPYAFNAFGIFILYLVMPNRRPDFRAIVVAAVVAGVGWQLLQLGYVRLQVGVVRYNAIYGALAQLPVTLVWIYVSWAMVLAGAELAATLELGGAEEGERRVGRLPVAFEVLADAARDLQVGGGGVQLVHVARRLRVARVDVEDVAEALVAGGLMLPIEGNTRRYSLAREPARIPLAEVAGIFAADGLPTRLDAPIASELDREQKEAASRLRTRSIADLVPPRQPIADPPSPKQ